MKKIKNENINTKEYWDSFSNDIYQEKDRNRGGNICKFSTVRDLIEEKTDVLDIGCFNGNFYNFLKENNFKINSFTGIDFSPLLIERAKNRFPEQKWICSDYTSLPFDSEKFDIITLMEILEHVENPKLALLEASRVCKKGGIIIITVPNEEKIKDPSHVWSFESFEIFNLLFEISTNVQILLTCSNNRNIVGKVVKDYKKYE